jgi:hypothetical protein
MIAVMQLETLRSPKRRPDAAPLWMVTNGEVTVGPVGTELLLKGVRHGRVPAECLVREVRWDVWRTLDQIREVSALKRRGSGSQVESELEVERELAAASDAGELLLLGLSLAVRISGARVGLVHRIRGPLNLPVTSCSVGLPDDCLGTILPHSDPALTLAERGLSLFGSPAEGLACRLVAERLDCGVPLESVLSVPIRVRGKFEALLELGRVDHAFRARDVVQIGEVAFRIGELRQLPAME